ncbi:hypothetical protein CEXT_82551 [Caerostris extrusa]|uniref:Secreted protein n=1 Tax=Caerostris extrusa TaxID=172846 RepID=A0AAV4M463_CAEEX|nr:hypothetical protein CEXT_82551 [Caerostris extrusa]
MSCYQAMHSCLLNSFVARWVSHCLWRLAVHGSEEITSVTQCCDIIHSQTSSDTRPSGNMCLAAGGRVPLTVTHKEESAACEVAP